MRLLATQRDGIGNYKVFVCVFIYEFTIEFTTYDSFKFIIRDYFCTQGWGPLAFFKF